MLIECSYSPLVPDSRVDLHLQDDLVLCASALNRLLLVLPTRRRPTSRYLPSSLTNRESGFRFDRISQSWPQQLIPGSSPFAAPSPPVAHRLGYAQARTSAHPGSMWPFPGTESECSNREACWASEAH
eukprot:1601350-Pyramimonas_sp.AAC.1